VGAVSASFAGGGTHVAVALAINAEALVALEEAGCHDPDILAHCREPGPHVCGSWAVDLLLVKE